jgi:hypothetical protein
VALRCLNVRTTVVVLVESRQGSPVTRFGCYGAPWHITVRVRKRTILVGRSRRLLLAEDRKIMTYACSDAKQVAQ